MLVTNHQDLQVEVCGMDQLPVGYQNYAKLKTQRNESCSFKTITKKGKRKEFTIIIIIIISIENSRHRWKYSIQDGYFKSRY